MPVLFELLLQISCISEQRLVKKLAVDHSH